MADTRTSYAARHGAGGRWLVRLGISILLLGIILPFVDLAALAAMFRRFGAVTITAAIALHVAILLTIAWRWHLILHAAGDRRHPHATARATFAGALVNQMLPTSTGGDLLRIWHAGRAPLPAGAAFATVLVDRIAGLATLALLCIPAILWFGPSLVGTTATVALAVVGAVAAAAMAVMLGRSVRRRDRETPVAPSFGNCLRSVAGNPRLAGVIVLISLLGHLLAVVLAWILARDVAPGLGIVDCLLLVPAIVLAASLPLSFAGWGAREGAALALLSLAGVGADAALALSVAFGLTQIAAALPGAFVAAPFRLRDDPRHAAPSPGASR